jgi:hypothetical protein
VAALSVLQSVTDDRTVGLSSMGQQSHAPGDDEFWGQDYFKEDEEDADFQSGGTTSFAARTA